MSMRLSALVLTTLAVAAGAACGCSGSKESPSSSGSGGESPGTSSSSSSSSSASTGSGAGGGGTVIGDCFQYTGWDGTTPVATFKADVLPIFGATCNVAMACHGSESPPTLAQHFYGTGNVTTMTAAQIQEIFAGAVGVPAIDEPDMDVIKPSDPAHSFMLYKLDATAAVDCSVLTCNSKMTCLLAMPYGLPQLTLADRDTIRRWIAQGAKND